MVRLARGPWPWRLVGNFPAQTPAFILLPMGTWGLVSRNCGFTATQCVQADAAILNILSRLLIGWNLWWVSWSSKTIESIVFLGSWLVTAHMSVLYYQSSITNVGEGWRKPLYTLRGEHASAPLSQQETSAPPSHQAINNDRSLIKGRLRLWHCKKFLKTTKIYNIDCSKIIFA